MIGSYVKVTREGDLQHSHMIDLCNVELLGVCRAFPCMLATRRTWRFESEDNRIDTVVTNDQT